MPNTVYPNVVLESKATDLLATKVNARTLMTIDNDLTESAGMKKTINTYTYTGVAEALNVGAGSTVATRGTIAYVGNDYTVLRLQQAFDYYDEDAMKDDKIVDYMLEGASQVMANKLTTDFYTAIGNTTTTHTIYGALSYDGIVDAIAKLNLEDESKVFILINNAQKAEIRKDDDYKAAMMGEVVYNGQVGTVCGIPVICSKAVPQNTVYVATAEAVKCFMKKDVVVETDRDVDTNKNSVYLKTYYIVALVDATKACKVTVNAVEPEPEDDEEEGENGNGGEGVVQ